MDTHTAWPDFEMASPACKAEFYRQMDALESFAQANKLAAAAAIAADGSLADDGARDLAQWIETTSRHNHPHARELARVAQALVELPAIAAVFRDGELSFDQVAEATRFATAKTDAEWAERAPQMSVAQLRREARRRSRDSEDGTGEGDDKSDGDDDAPEPKPSLTFSHRRDGNERLTADLDPAAMAAVRAALERQAESYGKDSVTGLWAPRSERLADALVDLITAANPSERADRATAVVHIDWATLAGLDNANAYIDMPYSAGLAADKARAMACDGRLDVWVDNPHGATIGIGRISCTWPPWLARKILHRDKGCRWPGCGSTIGLHIPPKGAQPFLPEIVAPAPAPETPSEERPRPATRATGHDTNPAGTYAATPTPSSPSSAPTAPPSAPADRPSTPTSNNASPSRTRAPRPESASARGAVSMPAGGPRRGRRGAGRRGRG